MLSITPSSGSGCAAPLYIYCPSAPFQSLNIQYTREKICSYIFIDSYVPFRLHIYYTLPFFTLNTFIIH